MLRQGLWGSIAGFVGLWAFGFWAFGMTWSALALALYAVLWLPLGWGRGRAVALGCGSLLAVALGWVPLLEYNARVDALTARLERGPAAYSTREKLGIYGLNLAMAGVGAAVGFPEVAEETLLLAVPGPEVRVFRSNFPMASPQVRRAVASMMKADRPVPRELFWTYHPSESLRAGLALNSLRLHGRRTAADTWTFTGAVEISYSPRYRLVLAQIGAHPLQIEEGLFAMLEGAGWLHPYQAQWTWTVRSDDPRLDDLDTPRRGWLEAIAVRSLR